MQIINSTIADKAAIFNLYDAAIAYQKTKFNKHWQGFDTVLIEKEIAENRQYKIMIDKAIACIFAISFNDAVIWGVRDKMASLYIHRIVTNPAFRGNNYVKNIIEWAIGYCIENGKQFVRMDTWGDNQQLIDHYINCGFTFLGLSDVILDDSLPKHYQGVQLSLFEIAVKDYEQPL